MGKAMIAIPESESIVPLGFVSEEEKYDGMAGAELLVLPSKYESLSIVVLDSMKLGVPVLVNGNCSVLQAHCDKSGAGLTYTDYHSFSQAMDELLTHEDMRRQMGEKGKAYVEANYQWDKILAKLDQLIDIVVLSEGKE